MLVILTIRTSGRLLAQPSQREIPYFVDAAGSEYDLEDDAKELDRIRRLPSAEKFQANIRNNFRRQQRWRVYLRNDGTWAPDPIFGMQDYADRHYPVEYVLPLGYRGAFQVAWGVSGAPPLPVVNNKIEIYIPASGVYETSSALAMTAGSVASPEHQFYFEHDGKRDVIPHEPLAPGLVGINNGTTACRGMPARCYTYFVGSREEWQAARSARCPKETEQAAIVSGHDCSDVPPGSTQAVAEIAAPQGKPAIMSEFHGRTLNGRRVVLSIGPSDVTSWRFDGPELSVPDEPVLAAELKAYTEAMLASKPSVNLEPQECSPLEMQAVLQASLAGAYHFFRTPYSSNIMGLFAGAAKSNGGTVYTRLLFARGEQGWKLLTRDCHNNSGSYEEISGILTKISEFVDKARFGDTLVVLRHDGTFDPDDPSELQVPRWVGQPFSGYDMNGGKIELRMNDSGRGIWQRLTKPTLSISTDTLISDLNRALDRYIELLSVGNVEAFLAEGGQQIQSYEFYRDLRELADDSNQADDAYDFLRKTGDGQTILAQYGEEHFKEAMKKELLQTAIQSVDVAFTLQELKRLRKETPRIAPRTPFSPDFEALYTTPQDEHAPSQTARRMTGHGSRWAFHRE